MFDLKFRRSRIDSRWTALQPQCPLGAVTSKIHDRSAAVLHRIVEPVSKVLRDSDFLRASVPVLHNNFLNRPDLIRFQCVNQFVTRRHPSIPIIHHELDAGSVGKALHLARIVGVCCHRLLGEVVDAAFRTFAQDCQMPVIRGRYDHRVGLGLIKHLYILGVEFCPA